MKSVANAANQLNGLYTQRFNRGHKQVGHLFQGRYKAILVQKEVHLLELARYIVLNPVRAGMVVSPEQWQWSSYDYCMRDQQAPPWLDTEWLLSQFGSKRKQARAAYAKFVLDGVGLPSPCLPRATNCYWVTSNLSKNTSTNYIQKTSGISPSLIVAP